MDSNSSPFSVEANHNHTVLIRVSLPILRDKPYFSFDAGGLTWVFLLSFGIHLPRDVLPVCIEDLHFDAFSL
jgi:hypothetical protein